MDTFIKVFSGIFVIFGLIAGMALVMALPTMWLWNYLMPDLFSLKEIGFWQALALNFLSGILFKTSSSSK